MVKTVVSDGTMRYGALLSNSVIPLAHGFAPLWTRAVAWRFGRVKRFVKPDGLGHSLLNLAAEGLEKGQKRFLLGCGIDDAANGGLRSASIHF